MNIIAMTIGLSLEGRKWKNTAKVSDETSLNIFFKKDEPLIKHIGGFNQQELLE